MKKLFLFSVLSIGVVSVSQAGVRFGVEFGLPLPPFSGTIISRPAPAPVYAPVGPEACAPQQPAVYQAAACPAPVVAPPVYLTPAPIVCPAPTVIVEQPRTYVEFGSGY